MSGQLGTAIAGPEAASSVVDFGFSTTQKDHERTPPHEHHGEASQGPHRPAGAGRAAQQRERGVPQYSPKTEGSSASASSSTTLSCSWPSVRSAIGARKFALRGPTVSANASSAQSRKSSSLRRSATRSTKVWCSCSRTWIAIWSFTTVSAPPWLSHFGQNYHAFLEGLVLRPHREAA